VKGSVAASDLVENQERNVLIKVAQDQVDGSLVAKSLVIPFQRVKASKDFIKQTVSYANGFLTISITHLEDDRVTSPAHIDLRPQPLEAVKQRDLEPFDIPLGETISYVYQITNRNIPRVSWTLEVDGEKILEDGVDIAAKEKKTTEPPPAAPPSEGLRPGG